MSEGLVRACPSCGKKNRVLYSKLGEEARCGSCGAALPPPAEPLAVDQGASLSGLLRESALPVLVDFWAPWCGPCRTVAPEMAKVAERNAGKVLVVKVNTDVDPQGGGRAPHPVDPHDGRLPGGARGGAHDGSPPGRPDRGVRPRGAGSGRPGVVKKPRRGHLPPSAPVD